MKRIIVLLLLIVGLFLTGCAKKEETKSPTPVKNPGVEEPGFTNTFPLTGIKTNDDVNQRAVSVMINNHTKARPQSGLSKADVVYEMLAEGEITRFLAVFQSETPDRIGPVRSARSYYIELAKGLKSLYIAHGYSPEAKKMLQSGYVDNINGIQYDGTLFKRSSDRQAPHNSYITFANIQKGAKEKGYSLIGAPEPFTFLSNKQIKGLKGDSAVKASINYGSTAYNVQYQYNEQTEKYSRYSNGVQTIDAETLKPVLIDNVFIIETTHRIADNYGRRDIDLQSGGKGYLLQKGKVNVVEWENQNGRIIPVLNGAEVGLVPGKTWVNIIPNQPGLSKRVSLTAAGK